MVRMMMMIAAGLAVAACGPTERTLEVTGEARGFSGDPAPGVTIVAGEREGSGTSASDGRFSFTARKGYAANVLPVSGVYPDPAPLYAEGPGGEAGYGAAMALSISGASEPVLLILLPRSMLDTAQAQLDSRGEQCGGVEGRAFAHAFLGHLDQIAATDGFRRAIEAGAGTGLRWRVEQLLMAARTDCALSEENWRGDLAALERAFSPAQ